MWSVPHDPPSALHVATELALLWTRRNSTLCQAQSWGRDCLHPPERAPPGWGLRRQDEGPMRTHSLPTWMGWRASRS